MAAFRLAFLLGKTLTELCESMSWDEFVWWQAYLIAEPPDKGDNQRTAAIMAQITNMSGRSLKDGKRVTSDEFLGKQSGQSAEDQIAFLKGLTNG